MPLRREVRTLKKLCFGVINKDLSVYSEQDVENLPMQLREDVLQYDYEERYGNRIRLQNVKNRNAMIKANVYKLSTSIMCCQPETIKSIQMCQNLIYLDCFIKLSEQDMNNLLRSIPNIVVLKISAWSPAEKFFNDNMLEIIGDNCPNLEIFSYVDAHVAVTDDGIRRLCNSKSGGAKIKRLQLGIENKVTGVGWLVALNNLKELMNLDHQSLIDAFEKLFHDFHGSSLLPAFQFYKLPTITMKNRPSGFFDFIIKCCPNIIELSIEGEVPVFSIGSNLTSLVWSKTEVDLALIGSSFPDLEELGLENVRYKPIERKGSSSENLFQKLKKLSLISEEAGAIPITHLKFLLQNCPDLEELEFSHYDLADDSVIGLLGAVNPLRRLKEFHLFNCSKITKELPMHLLCMENQLTVLQIQDCRNIWGDKLTEIKSFIKTNNYAVSCY